MRVVSPGGRASWLTVAVLIVGVAAAGSAAVVALPTDRARHSASAEAPHSPPSPTSPAPASQVAARAAVRVEVPAIGVSSPLDRLTLERSGVLAVPRSAKRAGWFAQGSVPGAPGPAVIAGHVDSRSGPGVFSRLRQLRSGALVVVQLDTGARLRFRVTSVRRYAKDAFPTSEVYGPTPGPELRLITCGGEFDRRAAAYQDNVVAYAVPE
jgi:sortase (surface protein transpeptidase)